MRRVIGMLLAVAVTSSSGQLSALHFHAYADHDHPEHHHGLAAHDHHLAPPREEHEGAHLESCDPGQHAVSLVMGCAPPLQVHVIEGDSVSPIVVAPLVLGRSVTRLADVRVHGPPLRAEAPPRAPPLHVPA